ncbi:hypothetical protein [Streptomyces sp. NPDC006355]|uniref:hypothetical protein n=1 Tax=Streptomyces sp. NPDC006355 TaxID=3156758 RepID=UPI0033B04766
MAMVVFIRLISASNMIFYTYAADVLRQIAHIKGAALTMAMLARGVGGVIGSFSSGHLTPRGDQLGTRAAERRHLLQLLRRLPWPSPGSRFGGILLNNGLDAPQLCLIGAGVALLAVPIPLLKGRPRTRKQRRRRK